MPKRQRSPRSASQRPQRPQRTPHPPLLPRRPKRTRRRTMSGVFLTALRRVEVREVPAPEPGPGEVRVQMQAVGICGSDLHYWRCGRIGDQVLTFPQGLGHEPAGVIGALGRGVRGFSEGQAVAVEPGMPCGTCRSCRMGRANLCSAMRFLGAPGLPGALRTQLVMPAECLEPLPGALDPTLGSVGEPLGVAMQGFDLVRLKAGENVAVVGGGPVGLCVAALAGAQGARVVALADPRAPRRKVARRLGVERVTPAEPEAFLAAVRAGTGDVGAEVVVECAGATGALNTCVAAAARGGRVAVIGIPEVDLLPVNPHIWRRKELELVYVRRSNRTLGRCLRLLERTDLGLRRAGFFSKTIPLGGVQEALRRLDDRASDAVKIIIDPRLDE